MDKKLEKDLFKFTEEILKGYKHIEAFIKKTEEQLELKDKEELITTLQAINYDSIKISPTFSINRSTESKALDRVEEEVELTPLNTLAPNNSIAMVFIASFFLFLSCLSS